MIIFNQHKPTTLEEAIAAIADNLDDNETSFIKKTGALCLHHGAGTAIRNEWGLWNEDSVLHKHFTERFGLGHADDMSGLILAGVEARVNGKTYDPSADVERYKEHWRKQRIDPLTQEDIKA